MQEKREVSRSIIDSAELLHGFCNSSFDVFFFRDIGLDG